MKGPFMWRLGARLFQWLQDSRRWQLHLKRGAKYKLLIVDELYKQEE